MSITSRSSIVLIPIEDRLPYQEHESKSIPKFSALREAWAECIGTFILLMFGDGVVAQTVLSNSTAGSALSIHIAWGLGVYFGIVFAGGISGAHLNPAVTVTLACYGQFPWRKVPIYIVSQVVGAFLAAGVVYWIYLPALNHLNNFTLATAGIFATYPQPYETIGSAFSTEMVGTALLLSGIFAINDTQNQQYSTASKSMSVAVLVMAIGMAFGLNTGYAINPARDFGPRFFTWFRWGNQVFEANDYYFWVPIIAPLVGGVIGGGIYKLFIEMHHPKV